MLKGLFVSFVWMVSLVSAFDKSAYAAAAIEAARAQNCIKDYNGQLTTSDRVINVCENGFPNMDSYVTRLCETEECASMRIRPFAKVSFKCEDKVSSVNCI